MKKLLLLFSIAIICFSFSSDQANKKRWVSLFDGKTLSGWKVGTNPQTFKVEEGMIVVNGNVAHLYYDGPLKEHDFKDFEFKADIKTMPGANSGIYFHTIFQESSWPKKGYEVQVNNSHTDWRRTAGLYAVQDVREAPAKDEEWFTMYIKVKGKHIIVKVNDKLITDYTEPDDVKREPSMAQRVISSGTIALQGHDPKSTVFYKNIMLRVL
jgi:Domain of Unknown Function (DUF1080)